MSTLGVGPLLRILDSIAAGVGLFREAVGESADDAGTIAEGARNNVVDLLGEVDDDNDLGALILEFQRRQAAVTAGQLYRTLQGERIMAALDAHYGGTGGLNRFLATQGVRVHPNLRVIGIQIDAEHAMAPTVVTLGRYAVTGSGTGTLTPGSTIDPALYAGANVVLRTTGTSGAAAVTATLTLARRDGTTEEQVATIPAASPQDTTIVVGTPGTDLYVGLVDVQIAGGTSGDGFDIRTTVERALAL